MKFTDEQIEYIKNASDHVEMLCGGRGYGKTHQLIKEMEDKINQLQSNWNSLREYVEELYNNEDGSWAVCGARYVLDKMNELEGNDNNGK